MPALAPALGSLLLGVALEVADAARAAVVVGVCCPKLEGRLVVEATTRVEGTDDSDVELITAGSTELLELLETVVDFFGAEDVVSRVSFVAEVVGVDLGRTVVVLGLCVSGAMVESAVPVQPLGVIVVYTVR